MRKPNKQDFIFIWKTLLFILVTFIIYSVIVQYLVTDNCDPIMWGLWYAWYTCFWYFYFFDKISPYFYLLFLWITITPFFRKHYNLPNRIIYIVWILIFILYILYVYKVTPTDLPNGLPLRLGH